MVMRWKAFFFLTNGGDLEERHPLEETFGFKSTKCPPQMDNLKPFEEDLVRLIKNIKFKKVSNQFQAILSNDIKKIKNSNEMLISANKTRNLYLLEKDQYDKLLRENITKHYKSTDIHLCNDINTEAKAIAEELKIKD